MNDMDKQEKYKTKHTLAKKHRWSKECGGKTTNTSVANGHCVADGHCVAHGVTWLVAWLKGIAWLMGFAWLMRIA